MSPVARSPESPRRGGKPVWERDRMGRFLGGSWDYVRTAWWGTVSARVIERRQLVIAQAVIVRDGPPKQVLLSIRSDLFGWELPGGTLKRDESPEQAVTREVFEETGLQIDPERVVGVWVRDGFRPHTAHVFFCRVVRGTESPSHETPRLKWFDVDDLPEELFSWYEEPLRVALTPDAEIFVGNDWQGLGAIWGAMKIDIRMRWRGLPKT
jgi:ADP-ribose pyrophosphatase YjhB (NUDIX family)